MFETIDQILEGIEAELSLMRELGVRSVPFDRELLREEVIAGGVDGGQGEGEQRRSLPKNEGTPSLSTQHSSLITKPTPPPNPVPDRIVALNSIKREAYDFVFLHDRPLSEKGMEMLDKIIEAMGKTRGTAPLLTGYDPKVFPRAKVYIVMGSAALKKFMPDMRVKYFANAKSAGGRQVHFTYSPDYITRFDQKDPSIISIKIQMWRALKQLKNF
ncbi:MAG: hypothetical protein MJ109_04925 [Kiritimatiellae bacterium]|nr:hypothetical protein [Kiritimatiellia bacterium]